MYWPKAQDTEGLFAFTCLDIDLSARQRLRSTADPLDKASVTLEKVLDDIRRYVEQHG